MIEAPLSGCRQSDGSWRSVVDENGRTAKTEIRQAEILQFPSNQIDGGASPAPSIRYSDVARYVGLPLV
ncbi:unnamed protein product [Durusdinium trenchii]|uniref:Uncharacterized protein n=1 Tax=Durusdinium trenchii TaxID=1381693 RepID=A0ABP0SIF8_9DINO